MWVWDHIGWEDVQEMPLNLTPIAHCFTIIWHMKCELCRTDLSIKKPTPAGNGYTRDICRWLTDSVMPTNRVPGRHDYPSVIGVVFDLVNDLPQLVNTLVFIVCVHINIFCSKVPPLETINWAKVSYFPFFQTWKGILLYSQDGTQNWKLSWKMIVQCKRKSPGTQPFIMQCWGFSSTNSKPEAIYSKIVQKHFAMGHWGTKWILVQCKTEQSSNITV